MKARYAFSAVMLALAACGQGGGSQAGGQDEVCALIGDAETLFGPGAEALGSDGMDAMAGICQFQSADGRRGGDIITYTVASLGSVTPQAQMETIVANWDAMTETPLALVEGLGDAAQLATDLPGYQTQIVFRKGETLVMIAARSGDPALDGDALARRMAEAAAASLTSAPTP